LDLRSEERLKALGIVLLSALSIILFLSGCTAANTFPTVKTAQAWVDQGHENIEKLGDMITEQHKAMAPNVAPQLDELKTALAAFITSQKEMNATIANTRVAEAADPSTLFDMNTIIGMLLGSVGLGGAAGALNLNKKINTIAAKA